MLNDEDRFENLTEAANYYLTKIGRVSCKSQSAGSVSKRDCWNKCDVCGRFIPYDDIESGKAVHRMITPDSDVSYETFETLCAEHTPND